MKDNFYIDRTEIRNVDYCAYLFWLKKIHGDNSENYKNALPDTGVWSYVNIIYESKYLRHAQYENYPVVGVSLQHAKEYCKWRSDRVYEWMMIGKGMVDLNLKQNKNSVFTIENFISGKYPAKRKLEKSEYYPIPEYRLPTKAEWEYSVASNLDSTKYEFGIKDRAKVQWNTKEILENYTVDAGKSGENEFRIFGMIGNVAEMLDEPGVSKDGSWFHSLKESKIWDDIPYTKPMPWLGFRCVCSWKSISL